MAAWGLEGGCQVSGLSSSVGCLSVWVGGLFLTSPPAALGAQYLVCSTLLLG